MTTNQVGIEEEENMFWFQLVTPPHSIATVGQPDSPSHM